MAAEAEAAREARAKVGKNKQPTSPKVKKLRRSYTCVLMAYIIVTSNCNHDWRCLKYQELQFNAGNSQTLALIYQDSSLNERRQIFGFSEVDSF